MWSMVFDCAGLEKVLLVTAANEVITAAVNCVSAISEISLFIIIYKLLPFSVFFASFPFNYIATNWSLSTASGVRVV